MDASPTSEALALKINQLLTLSRGNRRERPSSNLNHAIQSLDGILLECQDFVEDLINNSHGESLATKYDYNQDYDALIKPLEASTPCR